MALSNIIIGISAGVGAVFIIVVVVVIILWWLKSKRREKERFERTASIRSSLNNLNKINSSLRGTKSTLTRLSDGQLSRRLNESDERSMNSTVTKHSQGSVAGIGINGSTYSISSGYDVDARLEPVDSDRRERTKPVHSLRPDRSGNRWNNREIEEQKMRDRGAREREHERDRKREDEDERKQRQNPRKNEDVEMNESDEESVNKRGLDDSDFDDEDSFDSEFDDEEEEDNRRGADDITAQNMHYNVHRSHEKLMERLAGDDNRDYGLKHRTGSRDDITYNQDSNRVKPFSSFAPPEDNILIPRKRLPEIPVRSKSREDLPTPPPDPRPMMLSSSTTVSTSSKPQLKPKPVPPIRRDLAQRSFVPSDQSSHRPFPVPRRGTGSQELLYNNEPKPQYPAYDPVYDSRSTALDKGRDQYLRQRLDSEQSSSKGPLYDPVYDGSSLDQTQSSHKYEPMEIDPSNYRNEQLPDKDYMPRPLRNPNLGQNRECLGPPPPAPSLGVSQSNQRYLLESDIDSYAPSIHSDVDYMPRQHHSIRNNFAEHLPSKIGMDNPPPRMSHKEDSNNYVNTEMPQPPPYSEDPGMRFSREHLDHQYRGSQDRLNDQPPPYSPGNDLMLRRHGGSQDVLYLNQGAHPKRHESIETEI